MIGVAADTISTVAVTRADVAALEAQALFAWPRWLRCLWLSCGGVDHYPSITTADFEIAQSFNSERNFLLRDGFSLLPYVKINPGRADLSRFVYHLFQPAAVTVRMTFEVVEELPTGVRLDHEEFTRHSLRAGAGLLEEAAPLGPLLYPPGTEGNTGTKKSGPGTYHHGEIDLSALQAAVDEQEVRRFHR